MGWRRETRDETRSCCFSDASSLSQASSLKKHSTPYKSTFITSKRKQQFPNLALFLSLIILITLSPFPWPDLSGQPNFINVEQQNNVSGCYESFLVPDIHATEAHFGTGSGSSFCGSQQQHCQAGFLATYVKFFQSILTNSGYKLTDRKFNQAEAKVLGKMAKMWYIKKKLKKLGKKLKKHTIAVPVFTTIPIYEPHPYFPQPHIAHVPAPHVVPMHHHHAAAASSYSPVVVSQLAAAAAVAAAQQQQQQQHHQHQHQTNHNYATSASSQQQQVAAYRVPSAQVQQKQQQQLKQQQQQYHHHNQASTQAAAAAAAANQLHQAIAFHPIAAANQLVNTYVPVAPIFVDESGGLYGTYGNAYGRYDGGWQLW